MQGRIVGRLPLHKLRLESVRMHFLGPQPGVWARCPRQGAEVPELPLHCPLLARRADCRCCSLR
eukprot:scaffold212198_cov22-Prasinocladus_malaysianus.AAC.1